MEIDSKLRLHFLNLYCMVVADGIVDPKELETIYRIGRESYGLSEEEINKAVVGAGTTYVIPDSPEERMRILYEMAIIAWAEGKKKLLSMKCYPIMLHAMVLLKITLWCLLTIC